MPIADLYYAAQRLLWRRLKPKTRGVKVMLFDKTGHILLIRNSYGDSRMFVLPGGGVNPFETPEAAARREIREEINCELFELHRYGTYFSEREGKRDSIWVFTARTDNDPKPDRNEVAEAAFFSLDGLPDSVSPATLRRITEYKGGPARTPAW